MEVTIARKKISNFRFADNTALIVVTEQKMDTFQQHIKKIRKFKNKGKNKYTRTKNKYIQ